MTITMVGNLVRDPDVVATAQVSLTKLRLATNDRVKTQAGEWTDGPATYIDVACWRKLGDAAKGLSKGDRVIVVGKLKGREYENKDGIKVYAYEIEAKELGRALALSGDSSVTKTLTVQPDVDSPWDE